MLSFKYILLLSLIWVVTPEYLRPIGPDLRAYKEIQTKCVDPGVVALIFDGEPFRGESDSNILHVLRSKGISGTFYIGKQNLENLTISEQDDQIYLTYGGGNQLGIQMSSTKLNTTSNETILKETTELENLIKDSVGTTVRRKTIIPPYGEELKEMDLKFLQNNRSYAVVKWSIDAAHDYGDITKNVNRGMEAYKTAMEGKSSKNSSFIALHRAAQGGSIELLYFGISYMRSKGYYPVGIEQCIFGNAANKYYS